MNRPAAVGGLIAAFLGLGCGKSDSSSIVVVTVTAPPTLPAVTRLRAIVTNAGSSDTRLFPQVQSGTPIQFDATFAVTFPTSRTGELDIAVDAFDSTSQPVATGGGSVVIVSGSRADAIVHLLLIATGDTGVPDADVGIDRGTVSDARNTDATPDVLQAGSDGRELGGNGGRGGSGGSFATGGAGGAIPGTGGTTTSRGGNGGANPGNPFLGGTTGSTGGVVASGGIASTGGVMSFGGAVSTGGVIGVGGGGGGSEPCVPARTITGSGMGNSGEFGTTAAFCFRTADDITGWNCSNFTGRTLKVNGVTETCGNLPLPAKVNGYYYFDASAGSVDYSNIYWY